jgi:type IX secretion system PorP/SprF family membrane protein
MRLKLSVAYRIYTSILALISIAWNFVQAQDPEFSQFYANPVYTNPAFAGSSRVGRIVMDARNQWTSISGAFRTFNASYDEHYDFVNGGLGFQATYDQQGVGTLTTINLNGVYSYQIPLTRKITARAAIQAGVVQKSIDLSKFIWYDQLDKQKGFVRASAEQITQPVILFPNFAAGFVVYSKSFYAGFAAHNLFEPSQEFFAPDNKALRDSNTVPRRYTGHVGLVIPLIYSKNEKRASNLYPNVMYMQQRQFNQLNIGLYISKGYYVFGLYYRQNSQNADAVILLLGLRTNKLKIGFSYDQTVSEARPGAYNSFEVSLAFELKKRSPKIKIRPIHCPDF